MGPRIWDLQLRGGRPYLAQAGVPLSRFFDGLKRVVFVEDKRDLQHLTTGDLVVVLGGSAGRSFALIEKLTDRLARAGAVGALIHRRSLKDDPPIELEGEFPLVLVPEDIEWAEVLQPLLKIDESLRSRKGNPEKKRQQMLEQILERNGRLDAPASAGKEFGLDLSLAYRCYIVCTISPQTPEVLARLEEVVAMELLEHDSLGTIVCRPTGIIAIESTGDLGIGEDLLRRALSVPKIDVVSIGVGRRHPGARGIFRSYREARWASLVGQRLIGPNLVTHFRDLGPYAWLEPLDFDHDGDACSAIETLVRHDEQHSAKLLETLQAFLESNRFQEAADQLFVHRNTLRYRLESIKKLTGLDVLESESRLVLEVQLRLAMVRGLVPSQGQIRKACVTTLSGTPR